jgi:FkbM family methyltransferase
MGLMTRSAFAALLPLLLFQAPGPPVPHPDMSKSGVRLVRTDPKAGLELWQTRLGEFWIPSPGRHVIAHLEWEQIDQKVYDYPAAHVQSGDVVLDCGAHIGYFTRVALRAGARMVVAIEPEPANLRALRKNFEQELRSGVVRLVPKGVWNKRGKLPLRLSDTSNDSHSLVPGHGGPREEVVELVTIDELSRELELARVDFIKMDIEGAETRALEGARQTLRQWRPRLALSSYHVPGDPANIAAIVWGARSDYHVGSKDVIRVGHGVVPKVLFFY